MQSSVLSLPAGPLSQTQQQAGCCSVGAPEGSAVLCDWARTARDGLALRAQLEMWLLWEPWSWTVVS